MNIFFLVILGLFIISICILCCVPPVSKDALAHHLAVPKLYLIHGGLYEIPSIIFSYYPMNLDLLYIIPLYFGNDIVPKFIHFGFALLTGWLIFQYLRQRINAIYGLLGILLFLTIPIVVKLSITVYVDLGVLFFSTGSLLYLFKWIENRFQFKFLIISALFCGLALGTKYNGLILLFLLTLFIPFLYSRHATDGRRNVLRPVGYGILFFFIALFIFSPWMARNTYWKNNPIYPLYDKWFNPPVTVLKNVSSQDAPPKSNQGIFTYRSIIYHESWWDIALLPVRIFFQGKDGDPQYFDGKLNPFLFFLPIFAFYPLRAGPKEFRNEKKILLFFSVLFFGFAFFSTVLRIRYISPIIPPLVILSVIGVKNIMEIIKKFCSQVIRQIAYVFALLMLTFFFTLNVNYIIGQFKYVTPFDYLNDTLNRDQYITRYRPEYPTMQYINRYLPSDALILFVFLGKRGYYCDRNFILGESRFGHLLKGVNEPGEVLRKLKGKRITHLLINYHIFDKWVNDQLTPKEKEVMKLFFKKHIKLLYYKDNYGISELIN